MQPVSTGLDGIIDVECVAGQLVERRSLSGPNRCLPL